MISAVKKLVLDFLFPIECLGCEQPDLYLCQKCVQAIPSNDQSLCYLCNELTGRDGICVDCRPKTALDGVCAATQYSGTIMEQAIHDFKFGFVESLAVPLAAVIAERMGDCSAQWLDKHTIIVPVPLHKRRYRQRGFNQSELLGNQLQLLTGMELMSRALVRTTATAQQAQLDRAARQENLAGAFSVPRSELVQGRAIVLLDDVFTTGVTMHEAAQTLKNAGAAKVFGVALAHG